MAIYYVRKTGNDGNAGTSAGAAWLTVGKAASVLTTGDIVYIGAGVYRENVQFTGSTPSSATYIIGDVDGANTGDPGEVRITAYLTDDKTLPVASNYLIDLNDNPFLVFQNLTFIGGPASLFGNNAATAACQNTQIINCTFISMLHGRAINLISNIAAPTNWLIDRCYFLMCKVDDYCIFFDVRQDYIGGGPFDVGIVVRNCVIFANTNTGFSCITWSPSVIGAASGTSVQIYNNTIFGGHTGVSTGNSGQSILPVLCYNNIIFAHTVGLLGAIIEDFNVIYAPTTYAGVSAGVNSQSSNYAPLMHVGQEVQQGKLLKPFGMPTEDSPFLGFGNNGTYTSSVDIMNRIRPSGGGTTWASSGKAVGAYERHDIGSKEVSVVDAATGAIKWRGPGDHRLYIPVNAASTLFSIKCRYDSNYGSGTKPTFRLETNNSIGVSTQSVTTTGAANTYNTMALQRFTPTDKGWVIVTMESYAAGSGMVYWDTLSTQ